jgi:hypothetical protein
MKAQPAVSPARLLEMMQQKRAQLLDELQAADPNRWFSVIVHVHTSNGPNVDLADAAYTAGWQHAESESSRWYDTPEDKGHASVFYDDTEPEDAHPSATLRASLEAAYEERTEENIG